MLRWCLDSEIERVQALDCWNRLEETGVPDVVSALLEFESGAIGVLEASGVLPESTPGDIESVLEISCTEGRTTVETPGSDLTVHGEQFDRPDTRHWPVINGRQAGTVSRQIDRFAAAIDGRHDMLATFEDGANAQTVASTIESALESDGPQSVEYR